MLMICGQKYRFRKGNNNITSSLDDVLYSSRYNNVRCLTTGFSKVRQRWSTQQDRNVSCNTRQSSIFVFGERQKCETSYYEITRFISTSRHSLTLWIQIISAAPSTKEPKSNVLLEWETTSRPHNCTCVYGKDTIVKRLLFWNLMFYWPSILV